ncbi:hypothetical protein P280DRAFT_532996 [Massarina eburnea CBS 473.64]|uniref:Uncharacterized protein n=1 Tax=Massarina eburnea CBS 473.64 TaxID=1395130 RepID=A0A6A6RNN9_9PLEO|nr:hypothetical protein P280DRAFT_532996 [Massarina eburnea CBS 473.64]
MTIHEPFLSTYLISRSIMGDGVDRSGHEASVHDMGDRSAGGPQCSTRTALSSQAPRGCSFWQAGQMCSMCCPSYGSRGGRIVGCTYLQIQSKQANTSNVYHYTGIAQEVVCETEGPHEVGMVDFPGGVVAVEPGNGFGNNDRSDVTCSQVHEQQTAIVQGREYLSEPPQLLPSGELIVEVTEAQDPEWQDGSAFEDGRRFCRDVSHRLEQEVLVGHMDKSVAAVKEGVGVGVGVGRNCQQRTVSSTRASNPVPILRHAPHHLSSSSVSCPITVIIMSNLDQNPSLIYHFAGALSTTKCHFCHTNRLSPTQRQTLCTSCIAKGNSVAIEDAHEIHIRRRVNDIFNFYIAVRLKTLSQHFELFPEGRYCWKWGIPGKKTELPMVEDAYGETRDLWDKVMLTSWECHLVLIWLAKILEAEFLHKSPLLNIDEVYFEPRAHLDCTSHWVYKFDCKHGRSYAVTFADRQLGLLPLVTKWSSYEANNINHIKEKNRLGTRKQKRTDLWAKILQDDEEGDMLPPKDWDMVFGEDRSGWDPECMAEAWEYCTTESTLGEYMDEAWRCEVADRWIEVWWMRWKRGDWRKLGFAADEKVWAS